MRYKIVSTLVWMLCLAVWMWAARILLSLMGFVAAFALDQLAKKWLA